MKTIFQKNTCQLPGIFLFCVLLAISFSCKKDMNTTGTPATPEVPGVVPDLTTKINSSVSGFVSDEHDAPVVGAEVKAGGTTVITDQYGYFEIKNVQVVKEAATVTVSYNGYFKAIKTYMATEGKAAFFRIKLLPKTIAGTITANAGGNVSLSNGLNISFPADAIKDASTGAAYSGTVNVAVQYIDPTSAELYDIMPGDLRGINTDGYIKGLTSFGMMAVELLGASGELLQVADGEKATLSMPIPNAALASAPATIPLWHFDESNGLWKEEGSATKTGNVYIGDVSHFSFWNCDMPNATIPLSFSIQDVYGNPLANVRVQISQVNSWGHICGQTDATGFVSVFVAADTSYSLYVVPDCGLASNPYLQTFSVSTTPVSLGNIVLSNVVTATVSGTITDCNGNPVTNGDVIMKDGIHYNKYFVDNTGSFSFSTMLCNDPATVTLIAEDNTALIQGIPSTYTLTHGANAVGNMQACGGNASTLTYLNFSVDGGTSGVYINDTNSLPHMAYQGDLPANYIEIIGLLNYGPAGGYVQVSFKMDTTGISAGSTQTMQDFIAYNASPDNYFPENLHELNPTGVTVNITEYGTLFPTLGYISGNLSGMLVGDVTGNLHPFTCSFRAQRAW
ncbi:MAG: carboxypeptidase regulatory-like domain-containing protein [Ferruginibacter sp.]